MATSKGQPQQQIVRAPRNGSPVKQRLQQQQPKVMMSAEGKAYQTCTGELGVRLNLRLSSPESRLPVVTALASQASQSNVAIGPPSPTPSHSPRRILSWPEWNAGPRQGLGCSGAVAVSEGSPVSSRSNPA